MLVAYIFLLAATTVYSAVLAQHRGTPHMGHQDPHHRTDHHHHHHHTDWPERPYAFSYNTLLHDHVHGDGRISRSETKDSTGRVQGSYSLNAEGFSRTVDYVADHHGFRARVRTNEPGTSNQNPADVIMESSNHGHNVYGNVHHRGHARAPVTGHGPGLLHLDITAANDRPAV